MKKSRSANQTAKSASKMHIRVGELLQELFPNQQIRQEYPVNKVNPSFPSGKNRFDWVVLGLKIVIEVHGIQHYEYRCFGGMTKDKAKRNYRKQLDSDWSKQTAAQEAGWAYLVVKYTEQKITAEKLLSRILEATKETERGNKIVPAKPKAKINNRKNYKWPSRKIPSRKFSDK